MRHYLIFVYVLPDPVMPAIRIKEEPKDLDDLVHIEITAAVSSPLISVLKIDKTYH